MGIRSTAPVFGDQSGVRSAVMQWSGHAEGHEVGVHTSTHANAVKVSPRRLRRELDQSHLAIAAATGHTTSLLRLPYSSQVDAIRPAESEATGRTGNYRMVYSDLDTEDRARPGVESIIQAGLPIIDSGAVVMLHGSGGDRDPTVVALDQLITELKRRG